jgi:hypothetical protein
LIAPGDHGFQVGEVVTVAGGVNLGCEEGEALGVGGVGVRVVGPANCALNQRLVASVVGGKVFEQFVLAAKFAQALEAVPDVGMSRDGRQRPAFAADADQYWDLVSRSRGQLGESVFDPGQSRIEEVQPGFDRSVVVTVDGVILFVPSGAEAENESAAADVIDGARHVGKQVGVAEPDPGSRECRSEP